MINSTNRIIPSKLLHGISYAYLPIVRSNYKFCTSSLGSLLRFLDIACSVLLTGSLGCVGTVLAVHAELSCLTRYQTPDDPVQEGIAFKAAK
jgi:hypothetical protein